MGCTSHVSIIPVNANANLLFDIMGKVGGKLGGRSWGCRVGSVLKEQFHYCGLKLFHTDLSFLVLAGHGGDKPAEKQQEKSLSLLPVVRL